MIILGVDPGTVVTGYGVIDASAMRAIDYGCIRPSSKLSLNDRYLLIFEAIEVLISKYCPEALSVETQYVKINVQSAIKLGMARGAIIVAAGRNGVPVFEYAPTKVKLAVVGTGRASKHQVQSMVQNRLKLSQPPTPEDAADALALAITHTQTLRCL